MGHWKIIAINKETKEKGISDIAFETKEEAKEYIRELKQTDKQMRLNYRYEVTDE